MLDLVTFSGDYIEDWSSGSCVNGEHGPNACIADRYQMCAWHMLPSTEAWKFINCNFQYQICLSASSSPGQPYPECYLDGVLSGCSNYTSVGYAALGACAGNSTSEAWMKASGAATDKVAGGHPLWAFVQGKQVSDDSAGVDAWAAAVLSAICSEAKQQGLTLPSACSATSPQVLPL